MFDVILRELIDATPGARGAVFCDREGETVNSVGASGQTNPELLNDYDLRVAGAQLATPIDLALTNARESMGLLQECVIHGPRETLLVSVLPDGYYIVLCMEPGALTSRAMFRLRGAAKRVVEEI
jgi:hypothetical protein